MDTDAGHHELGEVGIRNWGKSIKNAIDHLSELVIGSTHGTEKLWQMMFRGFSATKFTPVRYLLLT